MTIQEMQQKILRLKKEKEEAMSDYMGAFPNKQQPGSGNPDGETGGDR